MTVYRNPAYQHIWTEIYKLYKIDLEIIDNPQGHTESEFLYRISVPNNYELGVAPFQLARAPFGMRLEHFVEYFVKMFGEVLEIIRKEQSDD